MATIQSSRMKRALARALATILLGVAAAAPQVKAATVTIASYFSFPNAVAVDPGGNVFVADYSNHDAYEFLVADGFTSYNPIQLTFAPDGIAADGSGNLFVANYVTYVYKLSGSSYTTYQILGSGFNQPGGVAIDSAGNVYVADYGNNAVKEILAPAYTTVKTLGSGFNQPAGVALDSGGNVIVADRSNNAVKKIWAPDYTTVTTIGSGFSSPWGVAVDARDNVFVADTFNGAIKELVAPAYTEIVAFYGAPGAGFNQPRGVAVDAAGNVFVADTYTHSLKEIVGPVLPPRIATAFGAASIPVISGTTSLTFTISYRNAGASPGIAFTDNLPAGLVVATPNGLTNSCGGTAAAVAGSSSVTLSGASVTGSAVCTVVVNVQGTTSGVKDNSVQVSSTNGGAGNTSNATLTVFTPLPPAIAKAFGAQSIPLNGTTSLTFTITNPNANTSLAGVAFTDSMPAGLVIATPNGLTNSCGGTASAVAGSSSASLSGGTVTSSGSCAVAVNVQGTTGGDKNNSVQVSSTSGTGNTSNATLTVPFLPPTILKAFGTSTLGMFSATSLTFTVSNPNAGASQTGVAFTDSLPAGLVVATPNGLTNTCGGTATAVAGSSSASLSGGTVAGSGACTLTVDVQATTAGAKNNSVQVASTNGGVGNTSNASLTVPFLPPSIANAFGVPAIALNGTTSLTFTLTNPNAGAPETSVAFTGNLPDGLVVATPNGLTSTCGGTATAVAGASLASLSGGAVTASSECTVSIGVQGTVLGVKVNSVQVSSVNGGAGNTSEAMLTVAACTHNDTIYCGGFDPATTNTLRTGFNDPAGVAVDGSGNVFVADFNHNAVQVILAPGYTTAATLGSGFSGPGGVAIDADGNLFVADFWHSAMKKMLPPTYTTINTLGSGFSTPQGVAVDASGNVFVADTGSSTVKEILAPDYVTVNTLGSGFYHPTSVAVDSNGNVFVADAGNNAVKEILAPGYTTVDTLASGFSSPAGVAVDADGNVFVADSGNNAVKKLLAPGYTTVTTIGSGFNYPQGVAVDAVGNVFVADSGSNSVKQILAPGWPPFD